MWKEKEGEKSSSAAMTFDIFDIFSVQKQQMNGMCLTIPWKFMSNEKITSEKRSEIWWMNKMRRKLKEKNEFLYQIFFVTKSKTWNIIKYEIDCFTFVFFFRWAFVVSFSMAFVVTRSSRMTFIRCLHNILRLSSFVDDKIHSVLSISFDE